MIKLIKAELPVGTSYDQIKAIVINFRTARNSLRAVEVEKELFACCFTSDTLTSKFEDTTQHIWFH